MATPIGHRPTIVIDYPDPRALAGFYSQITGWPLAADATTEWI